MKTIHNLKALLLDIRGQAVDEGIRRWRGIREMRS
jgi:hypothetical protein